MNITVYSGFSKRINSTKQPTGGTPISNVYLKEATDIIHPSFIISGINMTINYVQAFGNFYYAEAKCLDANRTELVCELDHMATFKTQVGSYTGLIEYCSTSSDVTITDPRNSPTGLVDFTITNVPFTADPFSTTGCYILTVLNDKANGECGCTTYYALLPAQLQDLSHELYDSSWWTQTIDQFQGVHDGLVSCIWIPVDISKISGASEKIAIGSDVMTTAMGKKISNRLLHRGTGAVTINYSTYSGTAGPGMTYLEKSPYCTGVLYLPFVGYVPLSIDIAAYTKSITLHSIIDVITGDIAYQLDYAGYAIESYSGSIATKMPISSATYDGVGIAGGIMTSIGGAIGTVVSAAAGNIPAMLGAAGVAIGGAASATAKSIELHTQINGTNSSAIGANLGTNPYIIMMQNTPENTSLLSYQAEQGMPYFKVGTVSALGGYVKCANASVSIPGNGAEQETVNGYMNGGFYYE